MESRLWLLQVSLVFGLLGVQSMDNYVKLEKCTQRLHMKNVNLTRVIECMSRAANLTAYMEETLFRLDLLDRVLDKLKRNPQVEEYIPSPYEDIDDVLKIPGSVANFSCQSKLHVMQAVRRKLEQWNAWQGVDSALFKWPYKRALTEETSISIRTSSKVQQRTYSSNEEDQDLSCIMAKIIRNDNLNYDLR